MTRTEKQKLIDLIAQRIKRTEYLMREAIRRKDQKGQESLRQLLDNLNAEMIWTIVNE